MDKNETNTSLSIQTKSWLKDTEDLFDFEGKDIQKASFSLSKNGFIVSHENSVLLKKSTEEINASLNHNQDMKILCEISYKKNNTYQIINPYYSEHLPQFTKENMDRLWEILPEGKVKELKEGDIIKLGRVRLKFSSIVFTKTNTDSELPNNYPTNINLLRSIGNSNNEHNIAINNTITNISNSFNHVNDPMNIHRNDEKKKSLQHISKEPKINCRICYRVESDINDPLVTPCKCTGSIGYIHFKCLKQCIECKIQKKEDENFASYMWKSFNCEICLEDYPKYLKYKSKVYNFIDMDIPYTQYAICDYSLFDDNKKKTINKGMIVFRIEDDKEITVGRTQTNNVKLKDISVSRTHCSFIKKNDRLSIVDKGSKFGTLLYLKKPFLLNLPKNETKKSIEFVSGKHCFMMTLTSSWSFFSNLFSIECCQCKSTNDEEFIINLDTDKNVNLLKDEFNQGNVVNDSYDDLILNLSTIIIEEEEDEEGKKEETSINCKN